MRVCPRLENVTAHPVHCQCNASEPESDRLRRARGGVTAVDALPSTPAVTKESDPLLPERDDVRTGFPSEGASYTATDVGVRRAGDCDCRREAVPVASLRAPMTSHDTVA